MTRSDTSIHVLVIAHPDDESMFFIPTIKSLIHAGKTVWCLCLTTGDYDGLGKQRQKELVQAGKLLGMEKVIIRDDLKDHPSNRWPVKKVSSVIQAALSEHGSDNFSHRFSLITFDSLGVSGHCNHIDTFLGVCDALHTKSQNKEMNIVEGWKLESEGNLIHKYFPVQSWMMFLLSLVASRNYLNESLGKDDRRIYRWNEPWLNWKAMATHESQFVWYRRLFVIFSCYTYVNKLCKITPSKTKEG